MIEQNELITFLIGIGVVLFIWLNRRRIVQIPGYTWLLISYLSLFTGWSLTILEGFVLPDLMNVLEHACYMVSSLTAAAWCWFVLFAKGRVR
jgi:hypothetical protein